MGAGYNVESVLFTGEVECLPFAVLGKWDTQSRDYAGLRWPQLERSSYVPLESTKIFSMPEDELTDDYIANLLKLDAKNNALRYARVGLAALLPKKYVESTQILAAS
jgi:hypothetical protein